MKKIHPLILYFVLAGFYSPAIGMVKCTGNNDIGPDVLAGICNLCGNHASLQNSFSLIAFSKAETPNSCSVGQFGCKSDYVGFNCSIINLPNQFSVNQLIGPQIESPLQSIRLIMPYQVYGATCFTSKVHARPFCSLKPQGTKPAPAISASSQTTIAVAHHTVLANTFTAAINLKLFDHPYIYLS